MTFTPTGTVTVPEPHGESGFQKYVAQAFRPADRDAGRPLKVGATTEPLRRIAKR
jgi:hypothetical protein